MVFQNLDAVEDGDSRHSSIAQHLGEPLGQLCTFGVISIASTPSRNNKAGFLDRLKFWKKGNGSRSHKKMAQKPSAALERKSSPQFPRDNQASRNNGGGAASLNQGQAQVTEVKLLDEVQASRKKVHDIRTILERMGMVLNLLSELQGVVHEAMPGATQQLLLNIKSVSDKYDELLKTDPSAVSDDTIREATKSLSDLSPTLLTISVDAIQALIAIRTTHREYTNAERRKNRETVCKVGRALVDLIRIEAASITSQELSESVMVKVFAWYDSLCELQKAVVSGSLFADTICTAANRLDDLRSIFVSVNASR